jgi:glycosyltransferase involved in cell wall biosynthesis
MPAQTGNGLAMRAGLFLEALAEDHEVSLLVVTISGPSDPDAVPDFVSRRAARVVVLPTAGRVDTHYGLIARVKDSTERARAMLAYPRPLLCRFATTSAIREAAERMPDAFDVVHVLRLYMAPFAGPFLSRGDDRAHAQAVLDLDDDEPRTRRRLSTLHAWWNQADAAAIEAGEAEKYESFEREWARRFDRVLVCSSADRAAVGARLAGALVDVAPNAVRIPDPAPFVRDEDELRLLLVGSFGYFPNEDAAVFFGREIWPRIVSAVCGRARAWIVGSRPGPAVLRLGRTPGITVTGEVPSVTPYYGQADAAVNPIRAGGGTRIKAIEAFAHGVPLVSTTIGVEGLDAEAGRHVLVADAADEFAQACLRLARDRGLRAKLVAEARSLYREQYAFPKVVDRIRSVYRSLGTRGAGVDADG